MSSYIEVAINTIHSYSHTCGKCWGIGLDLSIPINIHSLPNYVVKKIDKYLNISPECAQLIIRNKSDVYSLYYDSEDFNSKKIDSVSSLTIERLITDNKGRWYNVDHEYISSN